MLAMSSAWSSWPVGVLVCRSRTCFSNPVVAYLILRLQVLVHHRGRLANMTKEEISCGPASACLQEERIGQG